MRRLLMVLVVAALMLMTMAWPTFAHAQQVVEQIGSIADDITMNGGGRPSGGYPVGGYPVGGYPVGGYPPVYGGVPYYSSEAAFEDWVDFVEDVNGW